MHGKSNYYCYHFFYILKRKENFVEREENIDWTFTSISFGNIENEKEILITEETIDYELLKEKQPILFFEEIILYEDELHDNGIAKFTIKAVRKENEYIK